MSEVQKYYEELIIEYDKKVMKLENILTNLEDWLKDKYKKYSDNFISNLVEDNSNYFADNLTEFDMTSIIIDIVQNMDNETLDKIQELKEKYK